jgi:hypothetical protein
MQREKAAGRGQGAGEAAAHGAGRPTLCALFFFPSLPRRQNGQARHQESITSSPHSTPTHTHGHPHSPTQDAPASPPPAACFSAGQDAVKGMPHAPVSVGHGATTPSPPVLPTFCTISRHAANDCHNHRRARVRTCFCHDTIPVDARHAASALSRRRSRRPSRARRPPSGFVGPLARCVSGFPLFSLGSRRSPSSACPAMPIAAPQTGARRLRSPHSFLCGMAIPRSTESGQR